MKTEIWISFNYGGWALVYSKIVDLPFTPFFGLGIRINDSTENTIYLENNDYCITTISYNLEKQQFEINIRNVWKHPVTDDTIDYVIKSFSDWEKEHDTNIMDLKALMARDH